jgi:hypothetical protein
MGQDEEQKIIDDFYDNDIEKDNLKKVKKFLN